MKNVAIIGSTGSIGTQTLEIVRVQEDLNIVALAAGSNIELLEKQAREFSPEVVGIWSEENAARLRECLADTDIRVVAGMDGLIEIAELSSSDILVTAIVGMIGIRPTIAAINAGKDIALANKETLVTAGHIIMPLAAEKNVAILPVDSEHSAIFREMCTAMGRRYCSQRQVGLSGERIPHFLRMFRWRMRSSIQTGVWEER